MKAQPAKLLVFDLDGTLIDSRSDLAASINHMRMQYELEPLPLETVTSFVGDGMYKLVERSLAGVEHNPDEALAIYRAYYFAHSTEHTVLYDGVDEGLCRLADAGFALAVLTNKPGEPSRHILEHFGLAGLFWAIIGGGDVPSLKPSPDGVEEILRLTGCRPDHAWMVGDHCTDLAVAQNAGIRSAFVTYGFGGERGYKPDAYFASFPELVGYFVGS